jgi:hypothetical protein
MTTPEETLRLLGKLVGSWTLEATHPALPGVVVHGTSVMEWLAGERFLIHRSHNDHADFPDSVSVIGFMDNDRVAHAGAHAVSGGGEVALRMHYFDSRGVFRVLDVDVDDAGFGFFRDAPGFSQRFRGTFTDGGKTINGLWELRQDDVTWHDDVRITYRRQ